MHITAAMLLVSLQLVLLHRESGQDTATASESPPQAPSATMENGNTRIVEAEPDLVKSDIPFDRCKWLV